MALRWFIVAVLCSVVASEYYLTIGPRTTDRPEGVWPNNEVFNGTEDRTTTFYSQTVSEDLLWCEKIKVPVPGMRIDHMGVYMDTANIATKMYLYDDGPLGYPSGAPRVERIFTSVRGKNEFIYTLAERVTYTVPYSGAMYCWLCLLHGVQAGAIVPSAFFFVANGEATDGPKKNWDNQGVTPYTWPTSDYNAGTASFLQLKTNVWIYGLSLASDTPTNTLTRSSSDTITNTKTNPNTPTPTESATATRTETGTATSTTTVTPVPTDDPNCPGYNGVPAPREVLTNPWVDFYPNCAKVGEEVTVRVTGWHNFWEHDVYFKVGRGVGYDDCCGVQPGSEIQLLVNNTIKLRALKADSYRICYKLRDDWEPIERKFNVSNPEPDATLLGYNSCGELLQRNTSWCGCFLGETGEHVHIPVDFPWNHLIERNLDKQVDMGCCVDNTRKRVTVGTGTSNWGWCSNEV